MARYYNVSPISVWDWPCIDYDDAVEKMHLDYEVEKRMGAELD